MIEFLDMMHALFAFENAFPGEVEVDVKDGILTVKTYVGMENTDLFAQARQMFEPV